MTRELDARDTALASLICERNDHPDAPACDGCYAMAAHLRENGYARLAPSTEATGDQLLDALTENLKTARRDGEPTAALERAYAEATGEGRHTHELLGGRIEGCICGDSRQSEGLREALDRIANGAYNVMDECRWCGQNIEDEHADDCAATYAWDALAAAAPSQEGPDGE